MLLGRAPRKGRVAIVLEGPIEHVLDVEELVREEPLERHVRLEALDPQCDSNAEPTADLRDVRALLRFSVGAHEVERVRAEERVEAAERVEEAVPQAEAVEVSRVEREKGRLAARSRSLLPYRLGGQGRSQGCGGR